MSPSSSDISTLSLHDALPICYPTVNAYGALYGSPEYATDNMAILDPKTHKATFFKMPVADPSAPESFGPPFHASAAAKPMLPPTYCAEKTNCAQRATNHDGTLDRKHREWFRVSLGA